MDADTPRAIRGLVLARQRLERSCWRGVELRPVELLLQAVEGCVTDLTAYAHAIERVALRPDRTQAQAVVFGRRLRLMLIFGDFAGRCILLADGVGSARSVAIEAVERRLHDGDPRTRNFAFDRPVVVEPQQQQQRAQGETLDHQRPEHDAECA